MSTLKIQNRMRRAWIIPATPDKTKAAVTINPGETGEVDADHWGLVKQDNAVIGALLSGRHLVVSNRENAPVIDELDLSNPTPPKAPEDLTAPVDGAERSGTVKVETVELSPADGDEPKQSTGRRSRVQKAS